MSLGYNSWIYDFILLITFQNIILAISYIFFNHMFWNDKHHYFPWGALQEMEQEMEIY